MKKTSCVLLALVAVFLVMLPGEAPANKEVIPEELLQASFQVRINASEGEYYGSGVMVRNGDRNFLWTAAHVVKPNKKVETVIDPKNGKPVVRCTFADVEVCKAVVEEGRTVGGQSWWAKVIRYSETHDIAVLSLYKKDVPYGTFFLDEKTIPQPGEALWHVGSMKGPHGINSVADGVFAASGRNRKGFRPDDANGLIYDQVSLNAAHPGSSGGGVFRKSDYLCIGLVTEFLGPGLTFGSACIVPTRRLHQFAKATKCEWTIDRSTKVPQFDNEQVMRDDIPLPADWKEPAPKPTPVLLPIPFPGP